MISLTELQALYLRDKDSYTLNNTIRNTVNMETMKIRNLEYDKKINQELEQQMNEKDPL